MKDILEHLIDNKLSEEDIRYVMEETMQGKTDDIFIGAFLTGLRVKGEEIHELKAVYDVMLKYAITIKPNINGKLIDTCGTGGDKIKTFNISTAAAFVAANKVHVAKHGNRSNTGYLGSADILEVLGYNLALEPNKVKESIEELNIGFLFAPIFHPAMRYVAKARKAIGIRTIFNILGPIVNPANIDAQIVGVSDLNLMSKVTELLRLINRKEAMVFHALDGLDELSTTCLNKIFWLRDSTISELLINPKSFNLYADINDIIVKSKEEAIGAFLKALNGYDKIKSDIVALNAAAALIIANGYSFSEAIEEAKSIIYSGKAYNKLKEFIKRYGDVSKLEELERYVFTR
jgi:anthranilate phosphoribosyltransferase